MPHAPPAALHRQHPRAAPRAPLSVHPSDPSPFTPAEDGLKYRRRRGAGKEGGAGAGAAAGSGGTAGSAGAGWTWCRKTGAARAATTRGEGAAGLGQFAEPPGQRRR